MIVHTEQIARDTSFFAVGTEMRGPLPPSERDFQVFERVVVEGATTREAAAEFGLSQTRVVQVRDRVVQWIGTEVPPAERLTSRQRLRLAASIAAQRIDFLYSQALAAWRASMGPQTTVRSSLLGETQITRESQGDTRYLAMALRISIRQLVEQQKTEDRGQTPEDSGAAIYNRPQPSPPVRECSSSAALRPSPPAEAIDSDDARPCPPEVCEEMENRRRAFLAALEEDTSPVQPPRVCAGGLLVDESDVVISLRETTCPLAERTNHTERPLTRHERRARQRLLERKLRARAK